jgi:murein DD-endopeptidase MepM/ murein hydrolase activator NlpD
VGALLALVLAAPHAALATGGGASLPSAGGGTTFGQVSAPSDDGASPPRHRKRRHRRARRRGSLVLAAFRVGRPQLFLYGRPARISFEIDGRARSAHVRLSILRAADRARVATVDLGERTTRSLQSYLLTGREAGVLPQGSYLLRISARDRRGRGLRRSARASSVQELRFLHHRFPLAGEFGYGGDGARFGAPRHGHTHQGQDLTAAEGTPIVAPRGGTVEAVRYQADGAGHYVVLDGEGEDRDYAFMHLRAGSTVVREGQRVRTGQHLGDVGNTGSSEGAHLHFEVWVGGGWYTGGHPVDPLPLLRAWDRWS